MPFYVLLSVFSSVLSMFRYLRFECSKESTLGNLYKIRDMSIRIRMQVHCLLAVTPELVPTRPLQHWRLSFHSLQVWFQ